MPELNFIIILFFCAAIVSATLTYFLIPLLSHLNIQDIPNERSSHNSATPRGGGLAIMSVFASVLIYFDANLYFLIGLFLLAIISFVDDIKPLTWKPKIIAQLTASAVLFLPLLIAPELTTKILFLPTLYALTLLFFIFVWHMNVVNFMDGIDGYAASYAFFICLCCALIFYFVIGDKIQALTAATLAGAILGFLFFNWPRAKIFMGDVGSIPLGFTLGYFLLDMTIKGYGILATALPLWFLFDSFVTLLLRWKHNKPLLQAHKEHIYQRAANARAHNDKKVLWLFLSLKTVLFIAVFISTIDMDLMWVALIMSLVIGAFYFLMLRKLSTSTN